MLPCEKKGYLEQYSTCDNPNDFSNCGLGVVLYFSFIKYIISVMIIVSLFISYLNIYFGYKYTNELRIVCNDYYKNGIMLSNDTSYLDDCKFYFTEAEKGSENFSIIIDPYFFQFSSVNVKDYRKLYQKININRTNTFEQSIINISRINFCCLIFVFFFNLVFIYYFFNKSNQ